MKNLTILTLLVLLFWGISSSGQDKLIKIGDSAMKGNDYALAIQIYEKVVLKYPQDYDTRLKLADCYRLIGDYAKAIESYDIYISNIDLTPDNKLAAEIAYNYSDVLLRNGDILKAKSELINFKKVFKGNPDLQRLLDNCLFAEKELKKSPVIEPENMRSVNSPEIDYGPAFYNGNMIISSNRPEKNVSSALKNPYGGSTDLFLAEIDPLKYYRQPEILKGGINTEFSDGTFTYSNKTKRYYITQCRSGVCAIYKGKYLDGKWTAELVNAGPPVFNYGHPTITPDGKTVYFVSDKTTSKKGKNIWKSNIDGNGNFTKPLVLSGEVNTDQDEMFPYIIGDSILLFASTGHTGMGGFDIFKSEFKDGSFQKPINLGYPVNSKADDYSALVKNNLRGIYFASNREYETAKDEIYFHPTSFLDSLRILVIDSKTGKHLKGASVTIKQGGDIEEDITGITGEDGRVKFPNIQHTDCELHEHPISTALKGYISKDDTIPCFSKEEKVIKMDPGPCVDKLLSGKVYDVYKDTVVPDAKVVLVSRSGYKDSTITDNEGIYRFEKVPCDEIITITVSKKDYYTQSFEDKTPGGQNPKYEKNIGITPLFPPIIVYFEFDSCRILPQYQKALDKLVKLFKSNPDKMITIESHTDERGLDDYNMRLSNCRGLEVKNYLISKGVTYKMLDNKDFGESMPVIKGASTEEEHQKNRRTEFRASYLNSILKTSSLVPGPLNQNSSVPKVGVTVNDPENPDNNLVSNDDSIKIIVGHNGSVTKIPPQVNTAQNTNSVLSGNVYRVQILASKTPVNTNNQFSSISDLTKRYGIFTDVGGGYTRYQIGEFSTPEEAGNLKSILKTRGYPGCFIAVIKK